MTGSFWDGGEDGRDRLRGCPGRGVDDQVATVPRLVLPAGDLLPVRQPEARDVHLAGHGPLAVRGLVGADELDLDQPGAVAGRDVAPGVPGHAERVDALGHHADAVPELLRGHAVGDGIPDGTQRLTQWLAWAGRIDDGLLDPVDADEGETGLASQGTGHRALASGGQAAHHDENRRAHRRVAPTPSQPGSAGAQEVRELAAVTGAHDARWVARSIPEPIPSSFLT